MAAAADADCRGAAGGFPLAAAAAAELDDPFAAIFFPMAAAEVIFSVSGRVVELCLLSWQWRRTMAKASAANEQSEGEKIPKSQI